MSDTGAEAVKPNPGSYWEGNSGVNAVVGMKIRNLVGLSVHIPLVIRPECRTYVVVVR